MSNSQIRSRVGWSQAESERLFALAEEASKSGRSLKSVFDEFAAASGRQANSIRNYYYAQVKQGDSAYRHTPAFVPFTQGEARSLLETVLIAQGRGESVRACTLRLGQGDDRAMLRYQNKYRSLIRTNPALVREVLEDLGHRGIPCVDPYQLSQAERRVGRPKKARTLPDSAAAVLAELNRVEGLDTAAFFEGLGALAVAAARGNRSGKAADVPSGGEDQAETLRQQLAEVTERYRTLLSCFRQLIRVNQEFLKMNSVVRMSDLSGYIEDLRSNVAHCEAFMGQTAGC